MKRRRGSWFSNRLLQAFYLKGYVMEENKQSNFNEDSKLTDESCRKRDFTVSNQGCPNQYTCEKTKLLCLTIIQEVCRYVKGLIITLWIPPWHRGRIRSPLKYNDGEGLFARSVSPYSCQQSYVSQGPLAVRCNHRTEMWQENTGTSRPTHLRKITHAIFRPLFPYSAEPSHLRNHVCQTARPENSRVPGSWKYKSRLHMKDKIKKLIFTVSIHWVSCRPIWLP